MQEVIAQTGALIFLGVLWRIFKPHGLEGDTLRRSLTTLVYVLLLPALVLVVLWRAPLGLDSLRTALMAAVGIFVGMGAARLWFRLFPLPNYQLGALLLASAFPNATYMGLPVLEHALGPWARSVAIQYDLFACTPLLLSVGIYLAAYYGGVREQGHPLLALAKVPPLWAAIIGVALNVGGAPLPSVIGHLLDMLGAGVVPLMLFSIGLSLRWANTWAHDLSKVMPVVVIQLLLTPLVVWWLSGPVGLGGGVRTAVVLEAAMPSMVLGIVLCDRFGLDGRLYAMAVTMSTALSMLTLPLWFGWAAP